MVVRVDAGLNGTLTIIAARLFNETRLEYSLASIVRGLIAIGLRAVTDAPTLAPLFVGMRVARGRKKGERRPPVAPLDLEFEDEHHEARARREVVARPRRS
jgi:hypothetical protein